MGQRPMGAPAREGRSRRSGRAGVSPHAALDLKPQLSKTGLIWDHHNTLYYSLFSY